MSSQGFSVFNHSISMIKSNMKTSHCYSQASIHMLSAQPRYDIFRNMECIHFVLMFVQFCKYSQVFARQNTKRKTRRLDMLSVVQEDILDCWFLSRCFSMEPVFQWPSFTELRDVKHKVLYHMTQEIKDKSTDLSVIVHLDKFLSINSCCIMHILTKDTQGRLNEDK